MYPSGDGVKQRRIDRETRQRFRSGSGGSSAFGYALASVRAPLLVVGSFLLLACGGPGAREPRPSAAARIVSVPSGQTVSFEHLIDALSTVRTVYVGERHDEAADHEAQLRVAAALDARSSSLAMGFEMFQIPSQDALDAFERADIDEATLLERTEWSRRWGFDFAFYRPLLILAQTDHRRMVALNVPQEIVHTVARGGLEALDETQRAALPELDLGVAPHRRATLDALREHPGMSEETLERFYLAQVLWDETMASRVAETLAADDAPERMIVFAGVMHVRKNAIPDRAARRGAGTSATVIPVGESELEEMLATDPPVADFLWVFPDDSES